MKHTPRTTLTHPLIPSHTLSYTPHIFLAHLLVYPHACLGKDYTAEDIELLQRVDNELARMATATGSP